MFLPSVFTFLRKHANGINRKLLPERLLPRIHVVRHVDVTWIKQRAIMAAIVPNETKQL